VLRLRAGSVHPVTAPPIEDGAVLVGDDGRIAAVGPESRVPNPPGARTLEFPAGRLVPGLVNCHTHLELTHLAGTNQDAEFPRWIRRVREMKEATPPEVFRQAAEQGIRDCWARGVTTVAETGSTGAVMEALAALGGRGIVYQEVFGPDPAQCDASMTDLRSAVNRLGVYASRRLRLGVSPHAPYTVSAPLYRAVAEFALAERLPVAVHLAESREETALVRDGTGPFADALRARGIPVTPQHRSPVQHLVQRGVIASGTLCVHCVQVSTTDVGHLKSAGATIAHCPRSNRNHGHGTAPLAAFRSAGLRVGLGTDSVVSVADLDPWEEAAAASLSGEDALRMMTLEGARALNWDTEIGSLEVGKQADMAVLTGYPPNPLSVLTLLAGRPVHQADA
jgi:5-methylthioadenosine/S-adenosylhomocysteine deaminase